MPTDAGLIAGRAPPLRVALIAGESSGDQLGGALMAALREARPQVEFVGVGGPKMAGHGLESLFEMSELAVMGLTEILPHYRHLKRRIMQTAEFITAAHVDVLITIDSPAFTRRVAIAARQKRPDLPVVHYVAPSVWAWRPGRAAKMAKVVDHVLALLPFEPELMRAAGMSCDFVGHPVVAEARANAAEVAAFNRRHDIQQPLLMVLPGSRRGEVTRLAPRFGQAVRALHRRHPMRVVIPVVPHLRDEVAALTTDWPGRPILVESEEKAASFAASDLALAASGTVSLELAANDVPMVIGYDASPVTRWLMARMMRIDTVTLVNLVSETRAVPEFLGPDCTPENLTAALARLIEDPATRAAQAMAAQITMNRLGRGGVPPGARAARSVLDFLDRGRKI